MVKALELPKKVIIYNTKGIEMKIFSNITKYDYSDLKAGMYIIIVFYNEDVIKRKILIKK